MDRYLEILSAGKSFRAVARWVVREGRLGQFSLAKEERAFVETRVRDDTDEEALRLSLGRETSERM